MAGVAAKDALYLAKLGVILAIKGSIGERLGEVLLCIVFIVNVLGPGVDVAGAENGGKVLCLVAGEYSCIVVVDREHLALGVLTAAGIVLAIVDVDTGTLELTARLKGGKCVRNGICVRRNVYVVDVNVGGVGLKVGNHCKVIPLSDGKAAFDISYIICFLTVEIKAGTAYVTAGHITECDARIHTIGHAVRGVHIPLKDRVHILCTVCRCGDDVTGGLSVRSDLKVGVHMDLLFTLGCSVVIGCYVRCGNGSILGYVMGDVCVVLTLDGLDVLLDKVLWIAISGKLLLCNVNKEVVGCIILYNFHDL